MGSAGQVLVTGASGFVGSAVAKVLTENGFAVRAMVRRADTNKVMDALYAAGARAILVSPIHAARI